MGLFGLDFPYQCHPPMNLATSTQSHPTQVLVLTLREAFRKSNDATCGEGQAGGLPGGHCSM
jgi:hypothetical protein